MGSSEPTPRSISIMGFSCMRTCTANENQKNIPELAADLPEIINLAAAMQAPPSKERGHEHATTISPSTSLLATMH
jgi:hypothetical protein